MANLVTKTKTKVFLIIFLVLLVVSILSIVFFKLNLGIEYMDATVISVQLDHEDTMNNIENKVSLFMPISKIEKEGTSNFYIYFQNITSEDASKIEGNIKADISGVISTGVFEYHAARERALIQRAEIIALFGIFAFSIYVFANFKNRKFSISQVVSIWFSELAVILANLVLLIGFGSILGKLGIIMDNNFWSIFFLSIGIIMIFRIYEILKVRMILKTLETEDIEDAYNKMIEIYWPEFIFISCFLALMAFLPLTVLGVSILKSSTMVIYAILIAFASVLYLKPFLQRELLTISNSKLLKKINFLNKKW